MTALIIILFICIIVYGIYKSAKDEKSGQYSQDTGYGTVSEQIMEPLEDSENLSKPDKQCPYCKETIKSDAVKCRHCGEMLTKKDTSSPFMTGCLWIFGFFFVLIFLVSLIGSSDNSSSSDTYSSVSSTKDLNCSVLFDGNRIIITNNDNFTYHNIKVELNDKWTDNVSSIGPGEHYAIGILNFSDEDGNRFSWMQKPKSCSISCDGGDYYATW